MSRVNLRALLGLTLFAATTCYSQEESEQIILANIDYSLSKAEIAKNSEEAMSGSKESAVRVMNYYYNTYSRDGKRDLRKALYWTIIGAENGAPDAQYRAYLRLSDQSHVLMHKRAVYWLRRAADQGHSEAKLIMNKCGSATPDSDCFGTDPDDPELAEKTKFDGALND